VRLSFGLLLRDAFAEAFSIPRNLSCWKKCGAVPLTMAPLHSKAIRREVPIGLAAAALDPEKEEDKEIALMKSLESMNQFYCDVLSANGCDGLQLQKDAPTRATHVAVTQPHSDLRVAAVKNAKTAGQLFHATGGHHLNSNDFFKANALKVRDTRCKELETKKKTLNALLLMENKVMELLERKGSLVPQNASKYMVPEIKLLLKWKKAKPVSSKKPDLLASYYNSPPPLSPELWTLANEIELVALKSGAIDMKDTAIGIRTVQMARGVKQNVAYLDPAMQAELLVVLQAIQGGDGEATSGVI
jgi:hypothetical protein